MKPANPSRRRFMKQTAVVTSAICLSKPDRFISSTFAEETLVYPDDAFASPPIDRRSNFETLSGVAPAWTVMERAKQFVENSASLINTFTGPATEWKIITKDYPAAWLNIDEKIRRKPETVSFRFHNKSDQPIYVFFETHELTWKPGKESEAVPWQFPAILVQGNEEKLLTYQWSQAHWPNRTTPSEPRYPLSNLVVRVEGLRPNHSHTFQLNFLQIQFPVVTGITIEEFNIPTQLTAGSPCHINLKLDGDPQGKKIDLEFRKYQRTFWRIRLTDSEITTCTGQTGTITREVPWFLEADNLTAHLAVDGYLMTDPAPSLTILNSHHPEFPETKRVIHNGRPAVYVNNKPYNWTGYSSYDYQPGNVGEFGCHGVSMFCIPSCAGKHIYNHVSGPTWIRPDQYDYSEVEERVSFSLDSNPEGMLTFRLSLCLPAFWSQEHPNDLVRIRTEYGDLIWPELNQSVVGSYASEIWRTQQAAALRDFLAYCKSRPWADRVLCIFLSCGVTEEWFAWASNDQQYSDYSQPCKEGFKAFLDSRAMAPLDPQDVIPNPELRGLKGWDFHPGTPEGRVCAAFHEYYSRLTADTISYFSKVVKEETNHKLLTGAFYGYIVQLASDFRQGTGACFSLEQVIDDPNIDFIAGIPLLDFRDLTNGYNPYISATESILSAGKLYLNENDLFSWLHPILWYTEYDPNDPRVGAIKMHQRECANDAVHGVLSQKFSLAASWHHDEQLQQAFQRQAEILSSTLQYNRTSMEEVAFVITENVFYSSTPSSTLLGESHKNMQRAIARLGTPVGVWLLRDLEKIPTRVRWIVIASSQTLSTQEAKALENVLAQGGRTILVVGPTGLIDKDSYVWTHSRPAQILGLDLEIQLTESIGTSTMLNGGAELSRMAKVRPRTIVNGTQLARFTDGPGAAAERSLPNDGRLIWISLPTVNNMLLRQWGQEAGIHFYAPENCVVHASQELVAITAALPGDIPISWKDKVEVRDLFDGWTGQGRTMAVPFSMGQTRLFHVTSGNSELNSTNQNPLR